MIKLMKYLKRSAGYIVLIIALLFLQAYCDLSLPNYTSNIINVGIQQNGIEDSVPEKIRKTSMDSLKLFMEEDDAKTVDGFYEEEPIKSFTDVREALKYMRELPEVAMNETEIHANPVTLVLPNKSLQISLKKLISEAKKLVIKKYTTFDEALLAYYNHEVTLHERILVEVTKKINGVEK